MWSTCGRGPYCHVWRFAHVGVGGHAASPVSNNSHNVKCSKRSDARAIFVQYCGYPASRVPQWLLEPFHRHIRHSVARRVCRSPKPNNNYHLFESQLQRTAENRYPQVYARAGLEPSDVRRRTIWANSLGERARPHDSGSGPCMPRKS